VEKAVPEMGGSRDSGVHRLPVVGGKKEVRKRAVPKKKPFNPEKKKRSGPKGVHDRQKEKTKQLVCQG